MMVPVFHIAMIALLMQGTQLTERQLQEALTLMRSGKMAQAEQKLHTLLRAEPRNANAINLLGILRGEQNRVAEAEKLFQQALEINPKLAGAAVNLGYLYSRMQRPEDALAAFSQAEKIAPNDHEIEYNIASLRADTGEFAQALAILQSMPPMYRPPAYPLVLARCYMALGRIDDLRKSLPEFRPLLSKNPGLTSEFVQLLLAAGMTDDAIALLEGIGGPAAGSFPIVFNLGEAYRTKGDGNRAAEYYRMALNVEPASVETLKRLSAIAQREGKWEEMFQYLTRAKNLAPNSASILHGFALSAFRTGHVADAQYAIHQALNVEPDNPEYLYLYGITQLSFADIPAAVETFRKYVRLKLEDPLGHLGLATALYESAQYEESLGALTRSRELDPNLIEPLYYMGMIAQNQGENRKALEYLDQVLAKDPDHAAAHAGRGSVYFKEGEFQRAKEELELAVSLRPDHATTHYQLSQVLVRLNQPERAQQELKLYTELKTRAEEARSAAARLLPSSSAKP